jgi:hypothetical protein
MGSNSEFLFVSILLQQSTLTNQLDPTHNLLPIFPFLQDLDLKTEFSPSPRDTPPMVSAPPTIAESRVTRDESLQPPPEPRPSNALANDHQRDSVSDFQAPKVSKHATIPEPRAELNR